MVIDPKLLCRGPPLGRWGPSQALGVYHPRLRFGQGKSLTCFSGTGVASFSSAVPIRVAFKRRAMLIFLQVPIRYDIGTLKSPRKMPDGRLVVDAKLTRTGVFEYMNPDGTLRREYRPPNEVFDDASLATFAMTSVTNDHPPDMVNPDNAKDVTVGMVSTAPRRISDHVAAELVIFDAVAIADIEAGKLELSCGYEAEMHNTPGISPEGIRYDTVQKTIRINHVAIVDVGRAGPEARIHMDGAQVRQITTPEKRADHMDIAEALKRIADLEVEKATEAARADRAEASLTEATARADRAEGERDSEKAKAEAAEKSRTDAAEGMGEAVKARMQLCFDAQCVDKEMKTDDMGDREIKAAIVKAVCDFDITKDHSDDYVGARFDGAMEIFAKSEGAHEVVRKGTEGTRNDGEKTGEARVDAAREAMLERKRNATKKVSK